VVSPTRRVDSSSDDFDLDISADPLSPGWSVVSGSVHVPIAWAQGDKNHDWWLDNIRELPVPQVHVRTEHHALGQVEKLSHFEFEISRLTSVETNEVREIQLSWGMRRTEPIVPDKWRIFYTRPGGATQEIAGPYKMGS